MDRARWRRPTARVLRGAPSSGSGTRSDGLSGGLVQRSAEGSKPQGRQGSSQGLCSDGGAPVVIQRIFAEVLLGLPGYVGSGDTAQQGYRARAASSRAAQDAQGALPGL